MAYANSRGEQLTTIVERLLMSLVVAEPEEKDDTAYYVSPKLKGFVTGIDYGKNASDDYREDLTTALAEKYL